MEEMDISKEEIGEETPEEMSRQVEEEKMSEAEEERDEGTDENESDSDDDDVDPDEAEVISLQALLRQNPYDYASHVALINKLQEMENERYRLQDARQNMSNAYPLTPELWLSWMRDEMKLANTAEERDEVTQLCERAVEDYVCKASLQFTRIINLRFFVSEYDYDILCNVFFQL